MIKTKQIKAAVLSTVVGVMSPLAMIVPASAAEIGWLGGAPWYENGANWSGGIVPGAGDSAVFGVGTKWQLVNIDEGNDIGGIKFEGKVNSTSSKSYILAGGAFDLYGDIEAAMTGAGGDHSIWSDINLQDDVTFRTSGVDSLAIGDEFETLRFNGNELSLDASGGSISIAGMMEGEGILNILKGKVYLLAEWGDDFNVTTRVSGGEVSVSNNTAGDFVVDGGVLKGDNSERGLLGDVTLNSGSVEPGNSPGCLNVTNLTLNGGTYEIELNGNAQCSEYDSTAVSDDVDLGEGDVTLDIQRLASFEPEVGDQFAIITYADDSKVTGNFKGLEDGDKVTLSEYTYQIDYDDDDAVVLSVTGTPSAPDTGVGGLGSNPAVTLGAAFAVLTSAGALRFVEAKKRK